MAVEDETIRAALHYIRRHALEDMRVDDVAHDIAVGRRPLERGFRRVLGRSVLEEIHRVRMERARELLSDTHLPIAAVAEQSGFSSARRLDVLFGELVGISPSAYRHRSQVRQGIAHVP